MNPEVTIIVPIYKSEDYLGKCIESILNQTLKNIEIILVNDGSPDKSGQIADKYALSDKRIKVLHQNNSGVSAARNNALKIANGKYIGFVDSDDYIDENMYKVLFDAAEKNLSTVAMCSYYDININGIKKDIGPQIKVNNNMDRFEIENNIVRTFSLNENYGYFSVWNKIYLKEWIIGNNFIFDENREHGEDWLFNLKVFNKLEKFVYINRPLYNYLHVNNESLMKKYRSNQFDLFLDGRLNLKKYVPSYLINDKAINKRFIFEFSSFIIDTLNKQEDKNIKKNLIKEILKNKEVVKACKNYDKIPIHLNMVACLIRNGYIKSSILLYKIFAIKKKFAQK